MPSMLKFGFEKQTLTFNAKFKWNFAVQANNLQPGEHDERIIITIYALVLKFGYSELPMKPKSFLMLQKQARDGINASIWVFWKMNINISWNVPSNLQPGEHDEITQ